MKRGPKPQILTWGRAFSVDLKRLPPGSGVTSVRVYAGQGKVRNGVNRKTAIRKLDLLGYPIGTVWEIIHVTDIGYMNKDGTWVDS